MPTTTPTTLEAVHLHRHNALAGGARRAHWSFVVPGLRVYAIVAKGLTLESRVQASATNGYLMGGRRARAQITIVRAGELIYRRDGRSHTLGPGQVAFDPAVCYDERWAGECFEILMLEYDESWGPAPVQFELGQLSPLDRQRATALTQALITGRDHACLDALLELYRGLGLGLARGRRWAPDPGLQAVANSLGEWMSRLDAQPQWCDLALDGRGAERTLRRRLTTLLQLTGVAEPYQGLRALLNVHRLTTGALLMTAPETSVAEVAAAIGYGSARAYCNAARRAGLPTPLAIRSRTLA